MSQRSPMRYLLLTMTLVCLSVGSGRANENEDSVLGTIKVDGSAGSVAPLPKLAVVPLPKDDQDDEIVEAVLRGDLALCGQFDVLGATESPKGPFSADGPLNMAAWQKAGAEYVVRAYAEAKGASDRQLVGELYLARSSSGARAAGKSRAGKEEPLYHTRVPFTPNARAASHRLVDLLLGALTGRPGGFASRMTFVAPVGRERQAFVLDADGFNLHAASPTGETALSPDFGPGNTLYYGLSTRLSHFRLATTAGPVSLQMPGSLMGLAFSPDRKRMVLIAMDGGKSTIYLESGGKVRPYAHAPMANHPSFGPAGQIAYVAGEPAQRVYVDQHPISPPGLMASSPTFCDTPQGPLVFYTVKTKDGSDIVSSYLNGNGLRRLTAKQGENWDPACSPDGRLLAFFSTRGHSRGLYVMPVARPWAAKKILSNMGTSLRWGPIGGPAAAQ